MKRIVLCSIVFVTSLYAGRKTQPECFDNIPAHNALQQLILNSSHNKLVIVKSDYTKSAMKKDKKQFKNYIKKQNKLLNRYFNNPNDNSSSDYEQSNEQPSATDDFIWGIDEESDSDEESNNDKEQTIDNNVTEIVTYNTGKPREYTRNMFLHCKRIYGKHYTKGNQ